MKRYQVNLTEKQLLKLYKVLEKVNKKTEPDEGGIVIRIQEQLTDSLHKGSKKV